MEGSSGGLIPQLMALSWDVNVRKVGVGARLSLDVGREGKWALCSFLTVWCHHRKRHPCLLPDELEENTGLMAKKLK